MGWLIFSRRFGNVTLMPHLNEREERPIKASNCLLVDKPELNPVFFRAIGLLRNIFYNLDLESVI